MSAIFSSLPPRGGAPRPSSGGGKEEKTADISDYSKVNDDTHFVDYFSSNLN